MPRNGSEPDSETFANLLEDYYAECRDHLTSIRRSMVAVEDSTDCSQIEKTVLEDLFRNFHSIKGLSGMVGLQEAEQIAHHLEHYLRNLKTNKAKLTTSGIDAILSSTSLLEQILTSHQSHNPLPVLGPHLDKLTAVIDSSSSNGSNRNGSVASHSGNGSANGLKTDENKRLLTALEKGDKAWCFEFTPNAARAEQGINVNSVRSRLQEIGELIRATPRVTAESGVVFEFLVVTNKDEDTFAQSLQDGLIYSAYESQEFEAAKIESPQINGQQETSKGTQTVSAANFVRVDLARLDDLMRMIGEMVITRARLEEKLKGLETTVPSAELRAVRETSFAIGRQLRDLREGVMHVRMVPLGNVFERMQFVIRDLARESGKKVKLVMKGQHTEVDKLVVERMMDPLLHLVRNAVSHGLETPDERLAQGKSADATIELRASTAGDLVVIKIEDDGRGIDAAAVVQRARVAGLISSNETDVDSERLLDLICEPGFSTRDQADRASGRGVGMAVVKKAVQEIDGTLSLRTELGKGTCFRIELPLTLAIAEALIVSVGDQVFAVPLSTVREVIEIDPAALTALEKNEILSYRGGVLPLLRLSRLFKLEERTVRAHHAFVIGTGRNAVGIVVDKIVGQKEIVVRAITDPLVRVSGIAGATELGDGRVVLILDAAALVRKQHSPL